MVVYSSRFKDDLYIIVITKHTYNKEPFTSYISFNRYGELNYTNAKIDVISQKCLQSTVDKIENMMVPCEYTVIKIN